MELTKNYREWENSYYDLLHIIYNKNVSKFTHICHFFATGKSTVLKVLPKLRLTLQYVLCKTQHSKINTTTLSNIITKPSLY